MMIALDEGQMQDLLQADERQGRRSLHNNIRKKIMEEEYPEDEEPSALDGKRNILIGPKTLSKSVSKDSICSCCNQVHRQDHRQVVGDVCSYVTTTSSPSDRMMTSLMDTDDEEDHRDENFQHFDDDVMMPGLLSQGVPYTVRRTLAQGWVSKKGSGKDWMKSRGWKARWAVLVLAQIEGEDIDIPLLLTFWDERSSLPSTVIRLDASVVLPVDHLEKNNPHRFQILHAKSSQQSGASPDSLETNHVTRTFAVPRTSRDAWISAISRALLLYEKDKAKSKQILAQNHSFSKLNIMQTRITTIDLPKSSSTSGSPSRNRRRSSPPPEDVYPTKHALQQQQFHRSTPPSSPRSGLKRPLPRHPTTPERKLLGEQLLGIAQCME